MKITRDSVLLSVGFFGSLIVAVAAHLSIFPWIPIGAQHAIEFVAFLVTAGSGKLGTSYLPGKPKDENAKADAPGVIPPAGGH